MNIVDLVRGMLFGYGLKAIQVAATILVVPFLLSMLGIDRYGRIFAIMSAAGVLTLMTDGLKLSFARSISQAIPKGADATGRHLGAGLKAMAALSLGVVFVAWALTPQLLDLLGVPQHTEYLNSVLLAAGIVAFENGFFSIHAYLTARARLDFLNAVAGAEVVLRNGALVLWFLGHDPRADAYFVIWLISAAGRYLAIAIFAIWKWPEDFRSVAAGRMREARKAVSYSLLLTLDSLQHYTFQRFSIPLVNRFIGPAEAGLLALGINTISASLAQVLFTVARPLLVPVAARLDLVAMKTHNRLLLLRVDALFAVAVSLTMVPLIALMPTVIGIWLGTEYDALIRPAQILVAGTAMLVSFNVRRSILIGQGRGAAIVRVSFGILLLALVAFGWSLVVARDWVMVSGVIAAFTALTSIAAVGLVFERQLLDPEARRERGTLRRTAALSLSIAAAVVLSRWAPSGLSPSLLVPAIGSLVAALVTNHFLVISFSNVLSTLQRLRSGARRSLFTDEQAPAEGVSEPS